MATDKSKIRESLFNRGVEALSRVLPDCPPGYICPTCFDPANPPLKIYQPLALEDPPALSIEHVPPKASFPSGPRLLVLTCEDCNSTAGHLVDNHLAELQETHRFGQGEVGAELRGQVTVESVSLNTLIGWSPGPSGDALLDIHGWAERNRPELVREATAHLARISEERRSDWTFTLTLEARVDPWSAKVSALRAAYLAVFAWLGYRWALSPKLDLVRQQIREPGLRLIPVLLAVRDQDPESERQIGVVTEPDWLQGALVVRMGRFQIFLPLTESASTFYPRVNDQLEAMRPPGATTLPFEVTCQPQEWPTRPMFELDLRPPQGRSVDR